MGDIISFSLQGRGQTCFLNRIVKIMFPLGAKVGQVFQESPWKTDNFLNSKFIGYNIKPLHVKYLPTWFRITPHGTWMAKKKEWEHEAHACYPVCVGCSVVPGALWLLGLWPARLLCPWDSPAKNTATLWMINSFYSGSTHFVSSASTSESILSKLINLHGTWNLRSFTGCR